MMIEPHVTFRFVFRGIASKNESLVKLRKFLHAKEWLPDDLDYDSLLDYHTNNDGSCEVILKKVEGISMEELVAMFFSDLCNEDDVKCVMVLYNVYTDKLVQNNSGKYLNRQTVKLSELKNNDEVIVLYRK